MKNDMFKPVPMKLTLFKNKKKYGDRDLDGSMNYRDCDPRRADRDGLIALALHKISKGTYGQSKKEFLAERKLKQKLAQARKMAKIKAKIAAAKEEAKLKRKLKQERLKRRFKRIRRRK